MTGRRADPEEQLDVLFAALSDRTRRRMLAALVERPSNVSELARPFAMSLPAVSKHLKILEAAGLVHRTIDGRVHRCRLAAGPLTAVEVWLDPFRAYWDVRLRDLARSLEPDPRPTSRRRGSASRWATRGRTAASVGGASGRGRRAPPSSRTSGRRTRT